MKHIYFTMRDDKSLLNEEDIALIAYAVCRKEFNKNNLKAEARDFAKLFDNLRIKEIENPSIKYLLKIKHITSAIRLYEDKYNCDYDTAVKNVTKMYDRIRRRKEKSRSYKR